MKTIVVEDTVRFLTEITVEIPPYMSEEEFIKHVNDAKSQIDEKAIARNLENKLAEIGFNITETESNYPKFPDKVSSVVVEVKDAVGGL